MKATTRKFASFRNDTGSGPARHRALALALCILFAGASAQSHAQTRVQDKQPPAASQSGPAAGSTGASPGSGDAGQKASQTPANRNTTPGATPKKEPLKSDAKVPSGAAEKSEKTEKTEKNGEPKEAGAAAPPANKSAAPTQPGRLTPSDGSSGIDLPFFAGGKKAPPPTPEKDWRHSKREPDLAFAAFQRGFFVTAFRLATERVTNNPNDTAAMTLLGEIYKDGLGVRESREDAIRWYRLAAERGDREAAFALGRAYLQGEGVKKDEKKAREFLLQAAKKDHGKAQYNLGMMALNTEERNFDVAARRFREAIKNGDLDAMYALAQLHRRGHGVPKDVTRATALLKRAAEGRHLAAETEYAIALFNGSGTAKDEEAGAKWFQKAAWRNSPVAQNRLARLYVAGRGVRRDMVKAMTWHVIARSNGLQDKWLDSRMPLLTRTQRELVSQAVRKFAGK